MESMMDQGSRLQLADQHLRLARRHVAETEKRVRRQRAKVKRLVLSRGDTAISTLVAKKVLQTLENALLVLKGHLATEEYLFRARVALQSRTADSLFSFRGTVALLGASTSSSSP